MPQFGVSLTDNASIIIYYCNMFKIQATGVSTINLFSSSLTLRANKLERLYINVFVNLAGDNKQKCTSVHGLYFFVADTNNKILVSVLVQLIQRSLKGVTETRLCTVMNVRSPLVLVKVVRIYRQCMDKCSHFFVSTVSIYHYIVYISLWLMLRPKD